MITWSYYGETAAYYLFGKRVVLPYQWLFVSFAFIGALLKLDVVINFSDAMIGLLVIPNSIAILLLSPKVVSMTKDYFSKLKKGEIKTYR